MTDSYPHTPTPGRLEDFLNKLKSIGVPNKIDQKYLGSVGFGSSNSRPFIPIMKKVGLLDSSGVPTDVYIKGLRGGEGGKTIVADGIRAGYSDLFAIYDNPQSQPLSDLVTYIRTNSTHDDRKVDLAAKTFLALCKFADFGKQVEHSEAVESETGSDSDGSDSSNGGGSGAQGSHGNVTINVNIALSVDATSDPKVYDAFFSAMAKHIKVLDGTSKPS